MAERTKRIIERFIIPGILAVALIIACVWGFRRSALAEEYKNTTETMYRRAFTELCDDFSNMESTLGKLRVVTSPSQYMMLLDDVWRLSGSSVSLMAQLPSSHIDTADLNAFVVRVGDYAHALIKKAVKNIPASDDDIEQLAKLHEKCREIAQDLNERLAAGDVPIAVITNEEYYSPGEEKEDSQERENIEEFPTLIYDGPFSESVDKMEAKGLSGGEVGEEQAQQAARALLGNDASLKSATESNGKIPSYDFTFTLSDGREADISITKQGGMVLWMMSSATGDAQGVAEEKEAKKLVEACQAKLKELGFENMRSTYAQYYDGAAVINFAATQDDVILYNDLVKVWIDRSTLTVIGIDARNYLFSHTERDLKKPSITVEAAEANVSQNLEIVSREMALIPLTPQTEVLCYEFKGTLGDEEYIVYVNVDTGDEEQVFKIINTDNGQLVI